MSIKRLSKISWTRPKVSCLMVTRNRPALARLNVEAFLADKWPWKELIIIDDSDKPESLEMGLNSSRHPCLL